MNNFDLNATWLACQCNQYNQKLQNVKKAEEETANLQRKYKTTRKE